MADGVVSSVRRPIVALEQRDGRWMATLDCGHEVLVRHRPPLVMNRWVLRSDSRKEALLKRRHLNCRTCSEAAA